jgi:hypothetical protein
LVSGFDSEMGSKRDEFLASFAQLDSDQAVPAMSWRRRSMFLSSVIYATWAKCNFIGLQKMVAAPANRLTSGISPMQTSGR